MFFMKALNQAYAKSPRCFLALSLLLFLPCVQADRCAPLLESIQTSVTSLWTTSKFVKWQLLLVFCLLNVCQEMPLTAFSLFFAKDLGMQPATVSAYYATTMLPYSFKSLIGLFSDQLPIFGYRRRPYLVIALLLLAGYYLSAAFLVKSASTMFVVGTLGALAFCVATVCTDALVIEKVNAGVASSGSIQSVCMLARCTGSLVASGASIAALLYCSDTTAIALTAALPLLVVPSALMLCEERVVESGLQQLCRTWSWREHLSSFLALLAEVWRPALFVFVWNAMPDPGRSYSNYLILGGFGFSDWQLSLFNTIALVGSLLGTLLYGLVLARRSLRTAFVCSSLFATLSSVTRLVLVFDYTGALGLSYFDFVAIDKVLLSVSSSCAFMPIVVLAASSCRPGSEAFLFASFMSVDTAGSLVGSYFASLLAASLGLTNTNWTNLWQLIVVCSSLSLVPLLLLPLLSTPSTPAAAETCVCAGTKDLSIQHVCGEGEGEDGEHASPSDPLLGGAV